jgi:hypothetical protein
MTEEEWLEDADELEMLEFVRGKASDRKLRLFNCACCRIIWDNLTDERCRQAVEVAERFADGAATWAELYAARAAAEDASYHMRYEDAQTAVWATDEDSWEVAAFYPTHQNQMVIAERCGLLLLDIIGNPFRPVSLAPSVLAWNDGTVPRIARGIYDERAFDRLPILADALLDAGCDDEELLAHCRSEGPHVKGCWAVDLILGRQ